MKKPPIDSAFSGPEWEKLSLGIVSNMADQLIADGLVKPGKKSREQIAKEATRVLGRLYRKGTKFNFLETHDERLLREARAYIKKDQAYEAILFYATWFEHWVNFTLTRDRFGLNEKERAQMVRETSLMGKFQWLLRILGFPRIHGKHLSVIRKISEMRNAFIHFKYSSLMADTHEEGEKQKAELLRLVEQAEKSIRYLLKYERLNLYSGHRGILKKVLRRKKDVAVKA